MAGIKLFPTREPEDTPAVFHHGNATMITNKVQTDE
jgi:hypothetical protein